MFPMLSRSPALVGSAFSFSISGPAGVSAIFCISAGVGVWTPAVALPIAGADAFAISAAAAAGLCDARVDQAPAIPASRQMTANVYACTLVHCSIDVDRF